MENADKSHSSHDGCHCMCHKMKGFMVVLFGLVFLLGNLEVISQHIVGIVWPSLLILAGLKKSLGRHLCKCCDKG